MVRRSCLIVAGLFGAISAGPVVRAQPAVDRAEQRIREESPRAEAAVGAPLDTPAQGAAEPGYLGVMADDRQSQGRGVRVLDVLAGGPAAQGGLQSGDLITAINQQPTTKMSDMGKALGGLPAGSKVEFVVDRQGQPKKIEVTLGQRRATDQRRVPNLAPAQDTAGAWKAAQPLTAPKGTSVDAAGPRLGVQALPITDDARRQFGLSVSKGALVSGVTVGSPAERAGIPLGAAITAFDGQPVNSPQELADLIRRAGAGREVDVTLNIRGQETHRRVMLASAAAPQASAAAPKETPRLNFQPRAEGATLPASPAAAPTRSDGTRVGELEAQIRRLEARIKSLEEALERNAKP